MKLFVDDDGDGFRNHGESRFNELVCHIDLSFHILVVFVEFIDRPFLDHIEKNLCIASRSLVTLHKDMVYYLSSRLSFTILFDPAARLLVAEDILNQFLIH